MCLSPSFHSPLPEWASLMLKANLLLESLLGWSRGWNSFIGCALLSGTGSGPSSSSWCCRTEQGWPLRHLTSFLLHLHTHTELYVALVAVNNMWGEKRYRGGENLSKRQSAKAKSFASVQEERETKSRADGSNTKNEGWSKCAHFEIMFQWG